MSKLEDELEYQLRAYKLTGWEREARFHSVRRWRFDYAFRARKLAIEVDGGNWSNGRHVRGSGFERDCDKGNAAILEGWRVLHFTAKHIKSGEAIQTILAALA